MAAEEAELAAELRALNLDQVTPLQALLKLHEWKKSIERALDHQE